jgi:hypothetical protein
MYKRGGDIMKMIDLVDHNVIPVTEYLEMVIKLSLRREMELPLADFDVVFNRQLEEFFKNIEFDKIEQPIYFLLHTDLGKQDRELMGDFILTRFVPYIIGLVVPEGREARLGVPVGLSKVHIQHATMMDLVNKYKDVKKFNIGIATRSGKNVIDLVA